MNGAERLVLRVYTVDLVLVVLTQKIAFPLGGPEEQVTAAMLIHFACLGVLALHGQIRLPTARLLQFCAFTTVVAVAQLSLIASSFSFPSMVLMLSISAMLLCVAPLGAMAYRIMLNRFVWVGLGASALVGVDWAAQLAGFGMPNLELLIPHSLVYYEYVYVQPLQWNSPWMKPNGVFFLEASHISQFIAMALVVEVALFRRWARVGALGVALLATFGVTGYLLAASSAPFLLARMRGAVVAAALVGVALVGAGAYQAGLLDNLLRRTTEFSQNSSSGYNRFVLPFEWSRANLSGPAERAWFGTGAGSMPKAVNDEAEGIAGYAWPPYTKVGVEYGGVALALWLMFIGGSLFGRGVPVVIAWVAFAQYNFLNGSLNVPIHTIYCVLLCAGYAIGERRVEKPAPLLTTQDYLQSS